LLCNKSFSTIWFLSTCIYYFVTNKNKYIPYSKIKLASDAGIIFSSLSWIGVEIVFFQNCILEIFKHTVKLKEFLQWTTVYPTPRFCHWHFLLLVSWISIHLYIVLLVQNPSSFLIHFKVSCRHGAWKATFEVKKKKRRRRKTHILWSYLYKIQNLIEVRDAAKPPTMRRTAPTIKNFPNQMSIVLTMRNFSKETGNHN